ncbi:MAG: ABC transporter permease, partial [Thermoplasmataceae archaeon]
MAGTDGVSMRLNRIGWWILLFSPSIFLFIVIIVPFTYVIDHFSAFLNFTSFFGNSSYAILSRQAFLNSMNQGIASAILSLAFGFPLGVFLGRYRLKYRRAIRSFIILPFFMPSIVIVIAFISLFGSSSPIFSSVLYVHYLSSGFTGIIAVNTFFNAPLVAFLTSVGIERSHKGLEEASQLLGASRIKTFANIWGRDGIIGAASGTVLSFLYSFSGFVAPLIIGGPSNFTVEAWIYFLVKNQGYVQIGVVFGLLQSVFLLIPLTVYLFVLSKQRFVNDSLYNREKVKSRRDLAFISGSAYAAIYIGFELLIFSSIIISSFDLRWNSNFTFNGYKELFGKASTSLDIPPYLPEINTLFYGALTAITVTMLGMFWIVGRRRLDIGNDSVRDFVQYVPLVIPSIMMALSISVLYEINMDPAYLWVLIVMVQSAAAIPVVLRVISGGFSEIPKSYTDTARMMGGNAFFEVELPLAGSALVTSLMFGFAISMGEFTATNFLSTNTFMPLSVEVYSLESLRMVSASYAAASILLILSFIFFFAIQKW